MSLPIPNNREQVYLNKVIDKNLENIPIPVSRFEIYLKCLLDFDKDNLPTPISKQELILYDYILGNECNVLASNKTEMFLKALSTVEVAGLPTPQSKIDVFLDYIIRNGCLEKFEYYPFTIKDYLNVKNTPKAKIKFKGAKGNTLILNLSGEIVLPGTSGAIIKSFGESENKIEVLSDNVQIDNSKNKFANIDVNTGKEVNISTNNCIVSDYMHISTERSNVKMYDKNFNRLSGTINCDTVTKRYYDINKNYLGTVKESSAYYVRYRCLAVNPYLYSDLAHEYIFKDDSIEYQPYRSSKAIPMYRNSANELVPVPALRGKWEGDRFLWGDEILEHDDKKLYYHKRCNKLVINGSESWTPNSNVTPSYLTFKFPVSGILPNNSDLISDKFLNVKSIDSSKDIELIKVGNSTDLLYINMNPTKLETPDVAGFKKWLQANNVTVVYQLSEEEIYPCELSEQLYSYDNETNIFINGGAVVGETTIEIGTKLGPIVDSIRQNVDRSTRAIEGLVSYGVQECAYQLYPEDFKNVPSVIEGEKNA